MERKKMNKTKITILWSLLAALLIMFSTSSIASEKKENKTTSAQDVKQETMEAMKAIKNYSYEQKDEAVKKVKAAMDNLDARIDRMQDDVQKNWNKMGQASREKANKTMKALRKKRNDLGEWYGGVKHSSANAWNHVKDGFVSGYESLSVSFDKAQKEFESK